MNKLRVVSLIALLFSATTQSVFLFAQTELVLEPPKLPILKPDPSIIRSPDDLEMLGTIDVDCAEFACVNMVLNSELKNNEILRPLISDFRTIRARYIRQLKAIHQEQVSDRQEVDSTPVPDGEMRTLSPVQLARREAIAERLNNFTQEFQTSFYELVSGESERSYLAECYLKRVLFPNFGVRALGLFFLGSGPLIRGDFPLDVPSKKKILDTLSQFEARSNMEMASDYCATVELALRRLSGPTRQRILELVPLSERDIAFDCGSTAATTGQAYKRWLAEIKGQDRNLKFQASRSRYTILNCQDSRVQNASIQYQLLFARGERRGELDRALDSIFKLQAEVALESNQGMDWLRQQMELLLRDSSLQEALAHPVCVAYCKLEARDIAMIEQSLKEYDHILRNQWRDYLVAGSLESAEAGLSPAQLSKLKKMLEEPPQINFRTYLAPHN